VVVPVEVPTLRHFESKYSENVNEDQGQLGKSVSSRLPRMWMRIKDSWANPYQVVVGKSRKSSLISV
jgi:hypothetical protein